MSAIGGGPGCDHNPSWLCPNCYPNGYGQRSGGWDSTDGGSNQGNSTTNGTDSTNSSSNNSGDNNPTCTPSNKC